MCGLDNFFFSISIKLDIDNHKKLDFESGDHLFSDMFYTNDRTIIKDENILKTIEKIFYYSYPYDKYGFFIDDFYCVKNLSYWTFSVLREDDYGRKIKLGWGRIHCYSGNELYELGNLIK